MSKFKKILVVSSGAILILATFFAILIFSGFLFARKNISYEADDALFSVAGRGGTRFFAYDDNEEVQEIELLSQNGVRKLKYNLNEISDYLKLGFIAMEDRDFYSHSGVNYKRTLGALANYVFRFSKLYGASTITQQVVKNISGDNEIKISRKLSEILRALHMEKMHSKDEILELYLNIVPMTDNMAGVGMGARAYFGKEPNELTLAESATIIGITNSPAKYNPYKHYNECLEKRNRVLYAMRECGVIDEDEYKSAAAEPINLKPKENITRGKNSWFIETVISDVLADFMQKYNIHRTCANLLLTEGGYDIYTTQNIEMQRILDEYFSNTENFPNAIENGLNYAMAITDSTSGNLLAIYGSSGEKKAERILNYATVNVTPGSVIKPLSLYAPLLDA